MEKDIITEDYVSFETAKVLKEKGFDVVTEKCYILDNSGLCAVTVGQLFNGKPQGKYEIAAPTLQMACKWLRVKFNLHVESTPLNCWIEQKEKYKNLYVYQVCELKDDEIKDYTDIYNDSTPKFSTYEEAEEAAILYCLTTLIK